MVSWKIVDGYGSWHSLWPKDNHTWLGMGMDGWTGNSKLYPALPMRVLFWWVTSSLAVQIVYQRALKLSMLIHICWRVVLYKNDIIYCKLFSISLCSTLFINCASTGLGYKSNVRFSSVKKKSIIFQHANHDTSGSMLVAGSFGAWTRKNYCVSGTAHAGGDCSS